MPKQPSPHACARFLPHGLRTSEGDDLTGTERGSRLRQKGPSPALEALLGDSLSSPVSWNRVLLPRKS